MPIITEILRMHHYQRFLLQKQESITPSRAAHRELLRIRKESKVFDLNTYYQIPRFGFNELVLGPLLEKSNFSNTYEIKSIKVTRESCNYNENDGKGSDFQTKQFVSSHCRREENGDARYAIKYLKKEITEIPEVFRKGAVNCVHDAALLCSLSHPNIVKIRGIALNGADGFDIQPVGGFFIILDRTYGTLKERIDQWKISQEELKMSVSGVIFSKKVISNSKANKKEQREFLASRLKVAYQLAEAMQYLHGNRILYGNLKPENIGFDAKGDVKLIDFCAAYEIPEDWDLNLEHSVPRGVGKPRYMAPEVAKHKPYNLMADVYSFSIILWEIIELKKAYDIYSTNPFFYADVVEGGKRPHIRSSSSKRLRKLLQKCWSEKISERMPFELVIETLRDEIMELMGRDDQGFGDMIVMSPNPAATMA